MPRSTTPTSATGKPLLPTDLGAALTWLSTRELETLLGAVQIEQKRRGAAVKDDAPTSGAPRTAGDPAKPKVGQVNAIRAALKAGVRPATVAKQFGISKAIVVEVASDASHDR